MNRFLLFIFLIFPALGHSQAFEDSLYIYNIYKDELSSLEHTHDYMTWAIREATDDSLTAPAFERLKKINGMPYLPTIIRNKESVGTAYQYPKPSGMIAKNIEVDSNKIKFSVIVWQTKFITNNKGKTRIPYIERVYFGFDDIPKFVEKLSPVTWEKLRNTKVDN